ncbi:protein adenylyltransferase SelO [Pollutimonas harenae]|uniref:Protein nucleotidyltransferase YdiU n=1 Tax=Pollutimonas harenae TaxID=657015 RepID=A0A853GRZ7_9BURK|nr:YdiU family protein [Pollutimonas harenae]NYT85868.1 YdiU family protein [Pollutimonas harenae]TEA70925.1 YdiU family protein [Pollutimonas harenae]
MQDTIQNLTIQNSFAELPSAFYTRLSSQPLTQPRLLHANSDVAALLGLSAKAFDDPAFLDVCSGTAPLPGGKTLAAVYSGHQFGVWAGQLGDGRAHLLGEVVTPSGNWEVQLKGSGRTPYSRMGDGRAVLRSSVREYLASEAMAGLGIPTTRALALVVSDDPVYRETVETAAVVTRVSPSFVRFGTFEHWAGSSNNLRTLCNYVIDHFYPECRDTASSEPAHEHAAVLRFLRAVVERTARLLADWQTAGFCHGVMNTDNMSILGLTIDYGPYGFMDAFQVNHVCNHSDTQGRYAWNAQPSVANWNLYRLASALMGLDIPADALKQELEHFETVFLQAYRGNLSTKLGFRRWEEGDDELFDDWWRLLHTQSADFTLSFRSLASALVQRGAWLSRFEDQAAATVWLDRYVARLARDQRSDEERIGQMNGANPVYVLRNHLAEAAIQAAARGDAGEIDTLLGLLREPYIEKPGFEAYASAPPDWASRLEVSCSS